MDPAPPVVEQQEKIQPETPTEKLIKRFRNRKLLLATGIGLLLVIVIPVVLLFSQHGKADKAKSNNNETTTQSKQTKKITKPVTKTVKQASQTLVYGAWTGQTSLIQAVDIATDKTTTLATLPLTIKKVTVMSNNSLLYIDETDTNDYGQRISIYNFQQKQIVTNIPADSGFGVDDYILSPDKKYLALWEVKLNPDTQTLQGGESRVYNVNLDQPSVLTPLYDETPTKTIPIHYPRAILNDGTVLTDQIIPNDPSGGAGWAYGMSIVNTDGSNKQNIASMTNGTYGSQPSISPDGKYLLFAGYDGINGDGTAIKNGYRQALLTPNTVELLDTKTLQRYKLPSLPDTNTYSAVQWDNQTGNIIMSVLSPDTKQMGVYSYDLGKLQATPIQLPQENGTSYGYISQLANTETLIGTQSNASSNLGNLGPTYTYAYTQLATLDKNNKLANFSLEDPFIQYITLLPQNYFKGVLGSQTKAFDATQPAVTYAILQGTDNTSTPTSKTNLASIRLHAESTPIGATGSSACLNLGVIQCSSLGLKPDSKGYAACLNTLKLVNPITNACY